MAYSIHRLKQLHFLKTMNIGTKLNVGFGILVALMLLVMLLSIFGNQQATEKINSTEGLRVPAALASTRAQANLLKMQAHVRDYLLLGDTQNRADYIATQKALEDNLAELKQLSTGWTDVASQQSLAQFFEVYANWGNLPEKLFALHDNPRENLQALQLARVKLRPLGLAISKASSHMIELQRARPPTQANLELLQDLVNFRFSFEAMVTNIYAYAASGEASFKLNFTPNLTANAAAWDRLNHKKELFTREQRIEFDNIALDRPKALELPFPIFSMVEGNRAAEDVYLFRTEVVPQANQMLALLDEITLNQQRQLQTELSAARQNLINVQIQMVVGSIIALIVVLTFGFIFKELIAGPVERLTQTAAQIAHGDLKVEAVVESADEIGRLAKTFNEMTNQLRQTLTETNGLFRAAQAILGGTELEEVCQKLISHFNELVKADWMILYLVDHETQQVVLSAEHNFVDNQQANLTYDELQQGISGMVYQSKQPVLSRHAYDGIEPEATQKRRVELGVGALMVVPFVTKDKVIGTVTACNRIGQREFTPHDVDLLMALTTQAAVTIEKIRLYRLAQQELGERKRAEAALQEANRELAALNTDKDKFLSIMAHDLRGPFMPLLGYTELLTESVETLPAEQIKDISESIHRTAKNTFSLLENLLDWSRMQMGRMTYKPERVDVNEVLENNIALLQNAATHKGITLNKKLAAPLYAQADEQMFKTILRNLTNNAIKFTPVGGMITLSAQADNDWVQISVADTGVGVSVENKAKLFKIESSHTTLGTSKETGTGLGLIMCKEMVEKHGGQIWVESEVGQGTIVKFTIPLSP